MKGYTRRRFLGAASVAGLAMPAIKADTGALAKPALLGGAKAYNGKHRGWPVFDQKEEQAILKVLRSGKWNRFDGLYGEGQTSFENDFARMMGANHCLALNSGTSALLTSLSVLGVGAGDEVILPPYTFVATVNVVLAMHAMPVFADVDPATQQIDPAKLESAITSRTAAIIPVHLGGNAADLDAIMAIANRHKIPVIEDACQSHLSEWKNAKLGTYGATGCFSFQGSKNMSSGDGGALVTQDKALWEKAFGFHSNGRSVPVVPFYSDHRGLNLRMTEFQAAIASVQMTRLDEHAKIRAGNAGYLSTLLQEIPGIEPARMYGGCTRNVYHLLLLRYKKESFAGMSREKFLKAAQAEGIHISAGYPRLNHQPFITNAFETRGFRKAFSKRDLDGWKDRNHTPESDRLGDEGCWMYNTTFLGERSEMDQIAEGFRKIQRHAAELARI